jgi:hypothetical protein
MNEQQRAVVQQALEVLKRCQMNEAYRDFEQESHTITALRQLLEQPVQEPVAWVKQILDAFPLFDDDGLDEEEHHCEWALQQDRKRLHAMLTAPPAQPAAWVGLTDEERRHLRKCNQQHDAFAIAIEAMLKEKNT